MLRREHPAGFVTVLIRTNDPCVSAFLLTSETTLPTGAQILPILQESEPISAPQSEVCFPNFTVFKQTQDSTFLLTCAQTDPTATLRLRQEAEMIYSEEFVFGKK